MKKLLPLVLVIALCMSLMTACGFRPETEPKDEPQADQQTEPVETEKPSKDEKEPDPQDNTTLPGSWSATD